MEKSPTRIPPSKSKKTVEEKFVSSHGEMREDGKTGTVEILGESTEGGAVFLNGVVIYARYREEMPEDGFENLVSSEYSWDIEAAAGLKAEDALEALLSRNHSHVRVSLSTLELVRMFRAYMRYISDEAIMTAEPLDEATIESHEVEGVTINGVETTESPSDNCTFFPEGKRTVLVADTKSLRRHITDKEATGYAVDDGEVCTFQDGEFIDRRRMDVHPSIRADIEADNGWVLVNTNKSMGSSQKGKRANGKMKKEDGNETRGLLGRFF